MVAVDEDGRPVAVPPLGAGDARRRPPRSARRSCAAPTASPSATRSARSARARTRSPLAERSAAFMKALTRRCTLGEAPTPRRRSDMEPVGLNQPGPAEADARVARLERDLASAVEHQRATSDILETIGQSAFDLEPVFETVVRHAVQAVRRGRRDGVAARRRRLPPRECVGGSDAYLRLLHGTRSRADRDARRARRARAAHRPDRRRVRRSRATSGRRRASSAASTRCSASRCSPAAGSSGSSCCGAPRSTRSATRRSSSSRRSPRRARSRSRTCISFGELQRARAPSSRARSTSSRARRDQPGGQLEPRRRRGADDDRHPRRRALGDRRRLDPRVRPGDGEFALRTCLRHERPSSSRRCAATRSASTRRSSAGPRRAASRARRRISRRSPPTRTSTSSAGTAGARSSPSRCCARRRSRRPHRPPQDAGRVRREDRPTARDAGGPVGHRDPQRPPVPRARATRRASSRSPAGTSPSSWRACRTSCGRR